MRDARNLDAATAAGEGLGAAVKELERRMRSLGEQAADGCEQLGLRVGRLNLDAPSGWTDLQAVLGQRVHTRRVPGEVIDGLHALAAAWLHCYKELTFLTCTRPVWNT